MASIKRAGNVFVKIDIDIFTAEAALNSSPITLTSTWLSKSAATSIADLPLRTTTLSLPSELAGPKKLALTAPAPSRETACSTTPAVRGDIELPSTYIREHEISPPPRLSSKNWA